MIEYSVIFIGTLVSCLVFDKLQLLSTSRLLLDSYKESFAIMGNKTLEDDTRQEQLLDGVKTQLALLIKLIFKIVIVLLPFGTLYILEQIGFDLAFKKLFGVTAILVSTAAVILFIFLKRRYG